MPTSTLSPRFSWNLTDALTAAGEPLLFGVRLWISVPLALFVAFWLEFDNPFWAATSAVIVCQPQLGASLRKGWFRMIGTVVGATMIVLLTACFPQDRIAFLGFLQFFVGRLRDETLDETLFRSLSHARFMLDSKDRL
jgi:hypothetical protein